MLNNKHPFQSWNRRTVIRSVLIAVSLCAAQLSASPNRPNIILILTDDQGYQDLSCYGSPDSCTPNIDGMARDGVRLTDFYVASGSCSPSRAAILTGRYPARVGVPIVLNPYKHKGEMGLNPKHVTLAEVLKPLGYATQAVGKWHLGDQKQFLPTNQGFDAYFGIPYSNDMTSAPTMDYAPDCRFGEGYSRSQILKRKNEVPLMRGELCIELPVEQSTLTRRYTDESLRFISTSVAQKKPFFLYLAHTMPHAPLSVAEPFKGKSRRGLYGDIVEEIDFQVGRILQRLTDLEVDENTLVIFTSDNGPWLIKGEDGGTALPLFEGKKTCFEGGLRVPCVMRWPNRIPAGTVCTEMALSMDLLPTIAGITGAPLSPTIPLDGLNIIDLITGKEGAKTPHKTFFYDKQAVRSGDWKYHSRQTYKVAETARPNKGAALYNLKRDIGESNNVMKEYPEVAARLKKVLADYVNTYPKATDVKKKN